MKLALLILAFERLMLRPTVGCIQRWLETAEEYLRRALQGTDNDDICEWSRSLTDLVDYAVVAPELFGPPCQEKVLGLLAAAAAKTRGTIPGEHCKLRSDDLLCALPGQALVATSGAWEATETETLFDRRMNEILQQSKLLDQNSEALVQQFNGQYVVFQDGAVLASGKTASEAVARIPEDRRALPAVVRRIAPDGKGGFMGGPKEF